jgi:hypothetical protein
VVNKKKRQRRIAEGLQRFMYKRLAGKAYRSFKINMRKGGDMEEGPDDTMTYSVDESIQQTPQKEEDSLP